MADDLLTQLRVLFPLGATEGAFAPGTVLSGAYQRLMGGLGVDTTWSLTAAQGWRQSAPDEITLDGNLTSTVLGIHDVPIWVRFLNSETPAADSWSMLIDISLPAGWRFGDSLPLLRTPLFDGLPIQSAPGGALIIASDPGVDPRRAVGEASMVVTPGLNFYGHLETNGSALAQLAWLLSHGPAVSPPLAGAIDYDAASQAVGMDLSIFDATVPDLFPGAPALTFGLSLHSGLNLALNLYESGVRVATAINFTGIDAVESSLELSTLFRAPDAGVLQVDVVGSMLSFPSAATLEEYFGADNGLTSAVAAIIDVSEVRIDGLAFGIGLTSRKIEYAALSVSLGENGWGIWPGVIELSDVTLKLTVFDPMGASIKSFDFASRWDVGGAPVVVRAQLPGKVLSGGLDPTGPSPRLKGLVDGILGFDSVIPDDLIIQRLDFLADIEQGYYSFDLEIAGEWAFEFGVDNTFEFERLTAALSYSNPPTADGSTDLAAAEKAGSLGAAFAINDNEFAVTFEIAAGNTTFHGSWSADEKGLNYQDIAIALGLYGLPRLPEQLDLTLQTIDFRFESAGPSFAFEMTTTSDNAAAMITGKSGDGKWGFVFGAKVDPNLDLDLAAIPVVGVLIPSGYAALSINELRLVGATEALPVFTPTPLDTDILGDVISSGLALSIDFSVGNLAPETFTVRFGGSDDGSASDTPPTEPPGRPKLGKLPVPLAAEPAAADPALQAVWIDVQRSFGPLNFQRVGFSITPESALAVALDAEVSLNGLTIGLNGLQMAMKLQGPFVPDFSLGGLSIAYAAKSFQMSGGLALSSSAGSSVYTGQLQARMGDFGATLLGSYSTIDGEPSLFAFLFVDQPLGGPAFFFVTGVAGGFGYNRRLTLPTIDTVAEYPLVKGAMGTLDQDETLTRLNTLISPQANQNWVALGVRFTSFEMVRSFALITASFGATDEIALIGQSTLSLPVPAKGEAPKPVAQADLQLLVELNLDQGYFAANARLAPSSFVLDRAAQLAGGFAFYTWFGPSPFAGDFVVTLGGYNPYFKVPKHYPTPPRLGLNWRVSGDLVVKGDLYFALTPSVVMAGGSLSCVWESGDLKAWFDAHADFLMRFKPFSYIMSAGITVGFSLTIDLWFTSKTISMEVGVDLTLYGDPFGGEATIDVYVVSFTIPFGADRVAPNAVGWPAFRDSFLPPVMQNAAALRAPARWSETLAPFDVAMTATDSLVTVTAPSGLLRTVVEDLIPIWIVDPGALDLVIATQIPSKSFSLSPEATLRTPRPLNPLFGIGPMGVGPERLEVDLGVTILRNGVADPDVWEASGVLSAVPTALWASSAAEIRPASLVPDTLTAVRLVPAPPPGAITRPVGIERLGAGRPLQCHWSWSPAGPPGPNPYDQGEAMDELLQTLTDPVVAGRRAEILRALRRQACPVTQEVALDAFRAAAADMLAAPPQLSALGGAPGQPNAKSSFAMTAP